MKVNNIPKKEKRYLGYLLVSTLSIIKTAMPLIESLLGLSLDVNNFLAPIEVSNEDILMAFEEIPGNLGTMLLVLGVMFVFAEAYIKDKEQE